MYRWGGITPNCIDASVHILLEAVRISSNISHGILPRWCSCRVELELRYLRRWLEIITVVAPCISIEVEIYSLVGGDMLVSNGTPPFVMVGSVSVGGWGVEAWWTTESGEGASSFALRSREMEILDVGRWISWPFSVVWLTGSEDESSTGLVLGRP